MKKVAVITSNRKNNYVKRVIDTIGENIPIHLFSDGNDSSYLNSFLNDSRISITSTPYYNNDSTNIIINQFWNFKNCLRNSYIEGENGILIFEDDVIFARGWANRFENVLGNLEEKCGDRFILSLFTSTTFFSLGNLPKSYYLEFPKDRFYGCQGMYYSKRVREELLNHFDNYDLTHPLNYDIIIRNYIVENNIPIFVTIPCLIEHIGTMSTWINNASTLAATVFNESVE